MLSLSLCIMTLILKLLLVNTTIFIDDNNSTARDQEAMLSQNGYDSHAMFLRDSYINNNSLCLEVGKAL
jgi:hypothetical protein